MSSLSYEVYNHVKSTLRTRATAGDFVAATGDKSAKVTANNVIGRYAPRQKRERKETGIPNPGMVVTYLGWVNNISQGTFTQDDGVIRVLIQIVDRHDGYDDKLIKTYMEWVHLIREEFQANPFTTVDDTLGHVYLVHTGELPPADPQEWALMDQMKQHIVLNCFTRTRYDKNDPQWGT